MIWRTRRYRGPTPASVLKPGAVVGATEQGALVACGAGCIEVLQAQVPPAPWVEGDELKRLLAPIHGAKFTIGQESP